MLVGAEEAYRLFDAELPGLPEQMPACEETVGGRLGWFIRHGGHSVTRQDRETWMSFADRWL